MTSKDLLYEDRALITAFQKRREARLLEINKVPPHSMTLGRAHEMLHSSSVHSLWGNIRSDNFGFFLENKDRVTHYMMRQVFGVSSNPVKLMMTHLALPTRQSELFLGMLTAFKGGKGKVRALVYCNECDYDVVKYVMIVLSCRFTHIDFEIRSSRPHSMEVLLNDSKLNFQTVVSVTGTYDVLLDTVRTYSDAEILLLPGFYAAFSVKGTIKGKCTIPFCNPISPLSYSPLAFSVPMFPGRCQCAICQAIGHCVTNTDECKILRAICSLLGDRAYCDGDVFSGEDPLSSVFYFLEDSHLSFKAKIVLYAIKDYFLYQSYVGDPIIGCMIEDTWHEMLVAQATLKQVGEIKEVLVQCKELIPESDGTKVLVKLSETHPISTPFFRKFICPRIHLLSVKRESGFVKIYGRKFFSHLNLTVPISDLLTEYMTLLMYLEAEAKLLAFDRGPSFFCDVVCDCGRILYYYKKHRLQPCNQCCFRQGRIEVLLSSEQVEADYCIDSREYVLRQMPFRKMRKRPFPRCLSCGLLFKYTDVELSLCHKCIAVRGMVFPFSKEKGRKE